MNNDKETHISLKQIQRKAESNDNSIQDNIKLSPDSWHPVFGEFLQLDKSWPSLRALQRDTFSYGWEIIFAARLYAWIGSEKVTLTNETQAIYPKHKREQLRRQVSWSKDRILINWPRTAALRRWKYACVAQSKNMHQNKDKMQTMGNKGKHCQRHYGPRSWLLWSVSNMV